MLTYIASPLRRFVRDGQANVGTIFALSVPVLALGVGIAVDFTNAAVTRNRLNAAADAAALSALTPAMMKVDVDTAKTAATNMFNGRVQALSNVSLVGTPNITVGTSESNSSMRVAKVSYSASVTTLFGGVLSFFGALPAGGGMVVGGTSTAQAAGPANVNFYLLLDNSPSMSLPATSAGITQMQNLTVQQGSCAFACHRPAPITATRRAIRARMAARPPWRAGAGRTPIAPRRTRRRIYRSRRSTITNSPGTTTSRCASTS